MRIYCVTSLGSLVPSAIMTDDDRTDYDSSSRVIRNVFLAFQDHLQASKRYDITIHEGMVINIEESVQCDVRDHSLLIPSCEPLSSSLAFPFTSSTASRTVMFTWTSAT
jgi:hypothetical protein